jgi:MFS family permease
LDRSARELTTALSLGEAVFRMSNIQRRRFLLMASAWAVIILEFSPATTAMGVYLLPMAREFHAGRAQVSLVAAAMAVASGLASPLAGWLIDQVDARIQMVAGMLIIGLGYLIGSHAHSLHTLVVAFSIIGVGNALGTLIPIWVLTLSWFKERRGLAIGLAVGGISIGFTLFPLLASRLLVRYGWRAIMRWTVVPTLVVALPMVLAWVRSRPEGEGAEDATTVTGVDFGAALGSLAFVWIAVMHISIVLGWNLFYVHLVPYLVGVGFTERTADSLLGFQAAFAIIGFLGNGWLADRLGPRGMMVIGFCIFGLSVISLRLTSPTTTGWVLMPVFMVGYSIAGGLGNFTSLIVVNAMGRRALGSILGVLNFLAFTLCQSSGPIIAGKIYDATGSYKLVFDLAGLLIVTGILATWAVYPLKGRDEVRAPASQAVAT